METSKQRYLEHLVKVKAVSRGYACIVRARLERFDAFFKKEGVVDIAGLTRAHLSSYQDFIMKKEISESTKRDELLAIQLFFKFLHDYGYIKDNPALVIDLPRKPHHIPRDILGEHEIAHLLRLPDQHDLIGVRDFCIMSLLYSSAMRPKEIFNIDLSDMDLKNKQVLVKRPKNKRDRIAHIDGYTVFFIRKYRPVIKEKFKKDVSPYAFRHSSATHWLDEGARKKRDILAYVQRQLGHESLESTAIYTHVAIEPLREMFKKYHPRELRHKTSHNIPSPQELIDFWDKHKDDLPPEWPFK